MTTTLKYEEFETSSGQTMFIEKYQDKGKPAFWRYGLVVKMNGLRYTVLYGNYARWGIGLSYKPNKKRLIEMY